MKQGSQAACMLLKDSNHTGKFIEQRKCAVPMSAVAAPVEFVDRHGMLKQFDALEIVRYEVGGKGRFLRPAGRGDRAHGGEKPWA